MQEPGARRLPEADEVSEVLREILAGPEFATFQQDPLARLLEWVWEEVQQLWRWLRESLGDAGPAAEIVTALVVVVVVVALVLLTRRYAPEWMRSENGERSERTAAKPVTAREWLKLASDRAGRGELRPAATALYQGFLLTLDRQGALSFHTSKTPGDYALEMARGAGAGWPPGRGSSIPSRTTPSGRNGRRRRGTTGWPGSRGKRVVRRKRRSRRVRRVTVEGWVGPGAGRRRQRGDRW